MKGVLGVKGSNDCFDRLSTNETGIVALLQHTSAVHARSNVPTPIEHCVLPAVHTNDASVFPVVLFLLFFFLPRFLWALYLQATIAWLGIRCHDQMGSALARHPITVRTITVKAAFTAELDVVTLVAHMCTRGANAFLLVSEARSAEEPNLLCEVRTSESKATKSQGHPNPESGAGGDETVRRSSTCTDNCS